MQWHLGRNVLYQAKAGLFHQAAQFMRRAQPPRAHGQQVEMEIGVAQGRVTRLLRHGFGEQQGAAHRQRLVNGAKRPFHICIGMIMSHTDQSNQVGATG